MSKFEVGDRVKVIGVASYLYTQGLTGKTARITRVFEDDDFYNYEIQPDGTTAYWERHAVLEDEIEAFEEEA